MGQRGSAISSETRKALAEVVRGYYREDRSAPAPAPAPCPVLSAAGGRRPARPLHKGTWEAEGGERGAGRRRALVLWCVYPARARREVKVRRAARSVPRRARMKQQVDMDAEWWSKRKLAHG